MLQHGVTPYLSVTWFAPKSAHTGCPMRRDASTALSPTVNVNASPVALTVAVAVPAPRSMAVMAQHGEPPAGWSCFAPSTGPIGRAPSTGPMGRAAILQHGWAPYL